MQNVLLELLLSALSYSNLYLYRFIELGIILAALLIFAVRFGIISNFVKSLHSIKIEIHNIDRRLIAGIIGMPIFLYVFNLYSPLGFSTTSFLLIGLGFPIITALWMKGISKLIGERKAKKLNFSPILRINRVKLFLLLSWIIAISFFIRFYFMSIRYYPRVGSWDTGRYLHNVIFYTNQWLVGKTPKNFFYLVYCFLTIEGVDLVVMPRLLIPLFYAFSTIPFFLVTRELTRDEKTAILGSFLFAMSGDSIRLIGDLYRNVLGIPLLLWAIFFTTKSFNSKNRVVYIFLSVFYVALTGMTHRLCLLAYFLAMLSYLFAMYFLYGDNMLLTKWLVNMIPLFILSIIGYLMLFPGLFEYLSSFEPVWAIISLERLANNWFFSIVTNILAVLGIYFSFKKTNFRYIFATSFLIVIYICWLLLGPIFNIWYLIARLPERLYLFAFIPASILAGIALTHLISHQNTFTKKQKYGIVLLFLCLPIAGFDVISIIHLDYFFPPPLNHREALAAYWMRENTSEIPVMTNIWGGARYYWIEYILSDREVILLGNLNHYEQHSSNLSDYYVLVSPIRLRVKTSDLDGIKGIARCYDNGDVVIYAGYS